MKIFFSFLPALVICCNAVFSQQEKSACEKASLLAAMLNKYHYSPPELNDETSEQIFKIFIEILDPASLYFTAGDIERLARFKNTLDDELREGNCSFLDEVTRTYRSRLQKADSLANEILSKPLDFTKKDTLFLSKNHALNFADDEKELKKHWEKWLKYQALLILFSPKNEDENILSKPAGEILTAEPGTRKKLLVKNRRFINRILDNTMGFENYISSLYLNAITARYDPHSMYFSASQKENFESGLASEAFAFGISFNENPSGEVQIERLAPGSPAWKSNLLHKGDILLKIKWPGKEPVDLSYSSLREVENMIRLSAFSEMELTVKKVNGIIRTVPLKKEKLRMDENIIKSYILKGERNIGYLSLPGFYTEFENPGMPGCANDVAKEILKMNKENIEGIILDLRFNGGGSLKEAIDLAGIFIDEGPLCIYSSKGEKPHLIKDLNRGTVYTGPLLLMVNGQSASASELISTALQDYQRALIVGSATFGKATGQVILPLDTSIDLEKYSPGKINAGNDYVKITMTRMYRVTGKSHQETGVLPDIILPGILHEYEYRESSDPYALNNDSVSKKAIYRKFPSLPVAEISMKSRERILRSENFSRMNLLSDSLKKTYTEERKIPLEMEAFRKEEINVSAALKKSENIAVNDSPAYTATNNLYDLEIFTVDSFRKEINDSYLENINADIYIDEAYKIMNDLITFGSEK